MVKHKNEVLDKKADLAGPGIGSYEELEKVLPIDYMPLLDPKETQRAITAGKRYIEDGLCRELNLMRVEVPLIVDAESGVNDYLDRDGSRGPGGPRGSGHWQLRGAGESTPDRLHAAARPEGNAAGDHRRQAVHRGRPLP